MTKIENNIYQLIKDEYKKIINSSNSKIYKDMSFHRQEISKKGGLYSGVHLQMAHSIITENVTAAQKETLLFVGKVQDLTNVTLRNKQLIQIRLFLVESFSRDIEQTCKNIFDDLNTRFKFNSEQTQIILTNLLQNAETYINDEISKIDLLNKSSLDHPAIRVSKRSNIIAIAALIIAVLSFGYTIIDKQIVEKTDDSPPSISTPETKK